MVSHADACVAMPTHMHCCVGTVLDILVLWHSIYLSIHPNIVRGTWYGQLKPNNNFITLFLNPSLNGCSFKTLIFYSILNLNKTRDIKHRSACILSKPTSNNIPYIGSILRSNSDTFLIFIPWNRHSIAMQARIWLLMEHKIWHNPL